MNLVYEESMIDSWEDFIETLVSNIYLFPVDFASVFKKGMSMLAFLIRSGVNLWSKSASSLILWFSSHSCAQIGFLTGVTREFLDLLLTAHLLYLQYRNLLGFQCTLKEKSLRKITVCSVGDRSSELQPLQLHSFWTMPLHGGKS